MVSGQLVHFGPPWMPLWHHFLPLQSPQKSSLILWQRCLQERINLYLWLLPTDWEVSGLICNQEPENVSAWYWRLYCELNLSLAFCSHLQIKTLQARHLRIIENKIHLKGNRCFRQLQHLVYYNIWTMNLALHSLLARKWTTIPEFWVSDNRKHTNLPTAEKKKA